MVTIPDFQTLMLPVLSQFADGKERGSSEVRAPVAMQFELSPDDLAALLPSGRQTVFTNRVAWALSYLKQANLLYTPKRGVYLLTHRGREVLDGRPSRIDIDFLNQFPEFVAFRTAKNSQGEPTVQTASSNIFNPVSPATIDAQQLTPDEQVRIGDKRIKESLAAQLLERIAQISPGFFEQLVIDLLVAMGYGGSHEDAASVVGRSGDGGIDGIIKEDRLGLESIYVQAKRWKAGTTVGRPDIQQFAGALQGHRARKGVFITTATFTREAAEYAKGIQTTIVLIDGQQLAQLMIEFGVGVNQTGVIKLMRLDEDYFVEE